MLQNAKQRAKKCKVPCTITTDDIIITRRCPVLGILLKKAAKAKQSNNTASLDRIDPKKGYVPGNVIVMSALANRIKNNANWSQIMKVGKWLKWVSRK